MNRIALLIANYMFSAAMLVTHIGGYVSCALGLPFTYRRWKEFFREKSALLISVFVIYGLAISVFSPEPGRGFNAMLGYFSQWLIPMLLGFCVAEEKTAKKLIAVFSAVFYLILVLSLMAYSGLIPKEIGKGYFLVGKEDYLLKGLRSHIAFGALCVMFMSLALCRIMFLQNLSRKDKILNALLAVIPLVTLFFTGSRGYYISAAVILSLLGLIWVLKTGKWKYAVITVIAGALVFTGMVFFSPRMKARLQDTGGKDLSLRGRFLLYEIALKEIKDKPVFGVGPGQGTRQVKYWKNDMDVLEAMLIRHVHLHSFLLNTAAEFGLIGLALVAAIFVLLLKKLGALAMSGNDYAAALAAGIFFAFLGVIIGDLFDTLLRGPGTAMELFWLMGMVFGLKRTKI